MSHCFYFVCKQSAACQAFQECAAQGDAAMCLQQMMTALAAVAGGAAGGGAGVTPCQGGATPPMPMPMPAPPMPMPMPMPYPQEQVIVDPSSCGGTYPCSDKGSKKKGKKHHDSKKKKHHKGHKEN